MGGRQIFFVSPPEDRRQHQPQRHSDSRQWKAGRKKLFWLIICFIGKSPWVQWARRSHISAVFLFIVVAKMKFLKVTVGTVGQTCALFDKPMYPAEIHKAVYTEVQPFSVIAAVMQQVRSRHVFEKRFTTWYLGTCFSTRFNKISFCLGVDSLLRKAYSDSPGVVFWYSEGK